MKSSRIIVQDTVVTLTRVNESDFISLTDIARVRNADEPKDVVKNWLRTRSTIEFLGLWEKINNPDFKGVEFDSFKNEAGSNSFTLSSPSAPALRGWIELLRDYCGVSSAQTAPLWQEADELISIFVTMSKRTKEKRGG